MPRPEMITFAPGILGPGPIRLPLLARTTDFFAVNKPAGVAVSPDPLWKNTPSINEAIVAALGQGKRQLAELGISHVGRVHTLDVEMTGVVVFAASADNEARLRNAVGSQACEFVFDVLAEYDDRARAVTCDLPVARSEEPARAVVSHRSGKKCLTQFSPVRRVGNFTLWEARTRENRPHQVRLHAAECGLRVPGESVYARVGLVFLSALRRRFRPGRDEEQPLHGPLCAHLREVRFPAADGSVTTVRAPGPRSFGALLRRLESEW